MEKGIIILSDYNGFPRKSKRQADGLLRAILEKEKVDSQYQICISPELSAYCRKRFRGLNYPRILQIAKSGKIVGKKPPTEKTREWRYLLQGWSSGRKRKEKFELVLSFESKQTVVFITAYPLKRSRWKK